jgi:hypothetical protein
VEQWIEKDKNGNFKATEYDKYENITGSVWLSLFMGSNGNTYYLSRRLAQGCAQLNTSKQYSLDPSQTMVCKSLYANDLLFELHDAVTCFQGFWVQYQWLLQLILEVTKFANMNL